MFPASLNGRFVCIWAQDEIERQGSVLVDYADLTGDQTVREALPDLTTELKEQPEVILNCLGVAIHQVYAHTATITHQQCVVMCKLPFRTLSKFIHCGLYS